MSMDELNAALRLLGQPEVEPEPQESTDSLTRIKAAAQRWGIEAAPKEPENDDTD